jgi:hypothetical protein
LRRRYLNDPNLFLHFRNYLHFEEELALKLNNLEFPYPKDDLYQVWLNWSAGSRDKAVWKFSVYFYSFAIISPWNTGLSFICTILHLLYLKVICAKFGYKWRCGSGEEVENVKVKQTDVTQTDERQTMGDQKRSLELSAQVS